MRPLRFIIVYVCCVVMAASSFAQVYQGRVQSRFYKEYKAPSKAVLKETLRLKKEVIDKGAVIAELVSQELQDQIDEQDFKTRDCQKQYDPVMNWARQPEMVQARRSYQHCLEQFHLSIKVYDFFEYFFSLLSA